MTLTLDSDLEQRLADNAAQQGKTPEEVVKFLLETSLPVRLARPANAMAQMLEYFEKEATRVPVDGSRTYSREELYEDHD